MIGLEDDLGVAVREETIALGLEFGPEFTEVVDAAVEDNAEPERRIDHRLLGGSGQIEDAEPAMAEGNPALHVEPSCIGTPRLHRIVHAAQRVQQRRGGISDFTTNAAHRRTSNSIVL